MALHIRARKTPSITNAEVALLVFGFQKVHQSYVVTYLLLRFECFSLLFKNADESEKDSLFEVVRRRLLVFRCFLLVFLLL